MTVPCMVCFLETSEIHIRSCCSGVICRACLEAHVQSKIEEAIVKIICPLGNCDNLISDDEVGKLISENVFEKYQRFKVEVERNPSIKTCPGCSRIHHYAAEILPKVEGEKDYRAENLQVTCSKCHLIWCFTCQAPWHYGLTCKEFRKGDKSLKIWAKNRGQPKRNACRCPKCHVFIQKSAGCDHMSCARCHTEFCYRCGKKYHHIKFIGNHYDRFSILGCKYNFKPDRPVQRMFVRGALFSGQVILSPVVAGLAAGVGCVVIGVGIVAAPFYGSYRLLNKKSYRKKGGKYSCGNRFRST